MPDFDLRASFERAAERFARSRARRDPSGAATKRRADAGRSRLSPFVLDRLESALAGRDRPNLAALTRELRAVCKKSGQRAPSRATVYNHLCRAPTPEHRVGDLPEAVQRALYNFEPESRVPEAQIAFYCFNYGDTRAMSFGAGLSWLALLQASLMRGFRPKSRGVLRAVMLTRGIASDGRARAS